MIGTIIDLLMNLTLLVTVSIASGFIRKRWERGWWGALSQGALFGGGAVVAMMRPLVFSQGVIFDGRLVMISICAFFFGPVATGIACLLTTAARVIQGGGGALTGVLVICSSALLGLGFREWMGRKKAEPTVRTFLALGLTVHVAMLALMLTLPGGVWLDVIRRIGLPVLLIFPLATLLIGEILVNHIASLRAVESLQLTRDILARFIRHSPIYTYIKEVAPTSSRVLYASENFIDMIGVPGHDMIGKTMEELFSAEFAAKMTADDWRVASSGEVLRLDEELNGRSYTTIKFPIRSGERVLLAGYTIDNTERTQTETRLAEKEVRLRTLVQSIPDMVWLKDVAGVYLLCNPMFERYYGVKEAGIVGKTDYDFVDREQADQFRANDRLAMEAGRPIRNEETITYASDGHKAVLETTKAPMVDEHGRLVGVLGIGHDISERKRLEEERRQLESQLQHAQRMESIGILAGGVAHDMNNVLGAIMGLASAHLESQPAGSPAHRAFDTIIKACERGGKMVRGLLNFSRQSLAEERELDLNTILREEANLLERTTLAKVHLEMDLAPQLRPIRGDANALTHAFMNLCVNAVDAMPTGGTLTLRTRNREDGWIEARVEDTGTGMTRDVLEKAMDPFFTTKGSGHGTGLGLSLVYSMVKAHKGQMELSSEPGRGTRVILRFPAIDATETETEPVVEPAAEGPSSSLSVLLVDDDDLIRGSLQEILNVLGHRAVTASSGEEALALLEGGAQPDVVILDMNMPGLGGQGTLPRLRQLRATVPVLLATGRADQTALDLIEAHPGVTLLCKPFGMKALQTLLESIAAGRKPTSVS